MKSFLKILFLTYFLSEILSTKAFCCNYTELYNKASNLLIEVPSFSSTQIKEHTFFLAGKIFIKEKIYKTSSNRKIKVRVFLGEKLPLGWKNIVFNFLEISENQLKDDIINGVRVKLFEKEEKRAIVFPIFEEKDKAFLIIFSSHEFSLKDLKTFCQMFPFNEFLGSCF